MSTGQLLRTQPNPTDGCRCLCVMINCINISLRYCNEHIEVLVSYCSVAKKQLFSFLASILRTKSDPTQNTKSEKVTLNPKTPPLGKPNQCLSVRRPLDFDRRAYRRTRGHDSQLRQVRVTIRSHNRKAARITALRSLCQH